MKLLAIETATEACSVALWCDGAILERHEIAPRRHGELVLPFAEQLLAEAGVGRRQLDAIAVGRGPGAFTGVRLAIALAQGLAVALGRPVVPVSTLATLALGALDEAPASARGAGVIVHALIDARMGEVYSGSFRVGEDGGIDAGSDEALQKPAAAHAPGTGALVLVGSGYGAYRAMLPPDLYARALCEFPDALPRARALARLAVHAYALGDVVDAADAQPVYLRDKVALTSAEQAAARARG